MKKSVAIIPARGGSKRIPDKNILDFHGEPMIFWTIKAALDSNAFQEIVVSSDSDKILQIAESSGVRSFKRDQYIDDHSPISEATIYTFSQSKFSNIDNVVQLMPNCPLRDSTDIQNSLNYFMNNESTTQISSCSFFWMNPWWAFYKEDNFYKKVFPEKTHSRSQDNKELFFPTGAIWIGEPDTLEENNSFYTGEESYHALSFRSSVDIDTHEDLELAKELFHLPN